MKLVVLLATALLASAAHAQFGRAWQKTPAIVIVADDGDPRIALVDEALAYWNRMFEDAGSAFRLPAATRSALPIPEQALQEMSSAIVGIGSRGVPVPQALQELPGDLTVVLAHSQFVSFASAFYGEGRRVVGIRRETYPGDLPNVMRNIIAHEFGHAIGLGHNADPTKLMCGRPAPCRPTEFASHRPHYFPLTDGERAALRRMYPPP